ncbi:nuclear transport factor 2 family protein [Variovorax sp. J22R24]|uniref:nuclear transport factor 2 family protein n=1 Tax=Variovorax gracilis TaxID=3053502 RepID=UPI0025776D0E|nr:nuclear transport factor 2 family protein [Variovorax sp. J22R24]MDM0104639.1 nuclear transport factor 2 family protein [Variovorax sp. J22R24]
MNVLPRLRPTALLISACLCAGGTACAAADDEVRAAFERFVQVQNAHDAKALEGILADSAGFLWITRGTVIWGRDGALQQFARLYAGTWRLEPEYGNLRVVAISDDVAQIHVPVQFTTGAAGQAPQVARLYLNQVLVRSGGAWRVMSILPIAAPTP